MPFNNILALRRGRHNPFNFNFYTYVYVFMYFLCLWYKVCTDPHALSLNLQVCKSPWPSPVQLKLFNSVGFEMCIHKYTHTHTQAYTHTSIHIHTDTHFCAFPEFIKYTCTKVSLVFLCTIYMQYTVPKYTQYKYYLQYINCIVSRYC